MRAILLFTVAALACLASTSAKDMFVGTNVGANKYEANEVNLNAIPNMARNVEKHYTFPGRRTIKGIICRDIDNEKTTTATITSGGVGYSNVNIRFVSEKGKGINYICTMYAKDH